LFWFRSNLFANKAVVRRVGFRGNKLTTTTKLTIIAMLHSHCVLALFIFGFEKEEPKSMENNALESIFSF